MLEGRIDARSEGMGYDFLVVLVKAEGSKPLLYVSGLLWTGLIFLRTRFARGAAQCHN